MRFSSACTAESHASTKSSALWTSELCRTLRAIRIAVAVARPATAMTPSQAVPPREHVAQHGVEFLLRLDIFVTFSDVNLSLGVSVSPL